VLTFCPVMCPLRFRYKEEVTSLKRQLEEQRLQLQRLQGPTPTPTPPDNDTTPPPPPPPQTPRLGVGGGGGGGGLGGDRQQGQPHLEEGYYRVSPGLSA
jgi:hypothetical protein